MKTHAREKLKRIIRTRYEQSGLPIEQAEQNVSVVVSLEEFFAGNDGTNCFVFGSIPELIDFDAWRDCLYGIRARPGVQDVLIDISRGNFDEPDEWPSADTAYVLTTAPPDEVSRWLEPIDPKCKIEEISEGFWCSEAPIGIPPLAPGMNIVKIWWD
jgi:hypothetical protein